MKPRPFILALLLSCSLVRPVWAAERIDFVIDLDGILLYAKKPGMEEAPAAKMVRADGRLFRIADGGPELLQSLLRISGARISFFSAGHANRNVEALKGIRLPDGRSAWEAAEGRVASRTDLTTPNGARSYGKDLRKVVPDADLSRAFLLDDQGGFALVGQERNLLWLPDQSPTFLEDALPAFQADMAEGEAFLAKEAAAEFISDRNKLARARGIVDLALERSRATGASPVDALYGIQWEESPTGPRYRAGLLQDLSLYRRGVALFKEVNPGYRFTSLIPPSETGSCQRGFRYIRSALQAD